MKQFFIMGIVAGLALASLAQASVTNYTFATSDKLVSQGATYCPTYSTPAACNNLPTVGVYAEQTSGANGTFVTPVETGSWWDQQSTENGLFTVTDSPNNFGTGIAPYNPSEGTSGGTFSSQDGITDDASGAGHNDNILLLQLSDIPANSTLSLLLQAGVEGDSFTVYTSTGAMPTSLSGMTGGMTNDGTFDVDEKGGDQKNGSSQPSTPQVTGLTITGLNASTTGWIAIQADCHYLLLDTLTINSPTAATPEPRFYGILLTGLLALAGAFYQRRRAQASA
jgi:hypothetical protein